MFLLLHFCQGELQVIDVFLQLGAFILQFPLLGSQFSIDFLLILQSLVCLFEFALELDLAFDEPFTSLLSIREVFRFLFIDMDVVNDLCLEMHNITATISVLADKF